MGLILSGMMLGLSAAMLLSIGTGRWLWMVYAWIVVFALWVIWYIVERNA